ncbi:MAG: UDP-N-acetylmuramate--L-alanine ligase [Bacteroidota bacterium]
MNYHFIAIGGAVMHNLALELHALGHTVTGSDDEIFEPAKSRLQQQGLLPETNGWYPEKITQSIDAVVLGMHAKADNPELIKAQELQLPIYSFPEFIYQHAKNKKRIVIAGSHGKTTSTGMLMHVLKQNNIDFDYLVGSIIPGYDRMVRISDAPYIIIEGDEYLTSPLDLRPKFIHYKANAAMITGIAWDHVNVFPQESLYQDQFRLLIESMDSDNPTVVWFEGDEDLKKIVEKQSVKAISYSEPGYVPQEQGVLLTADTDGNTTHMPLPFFGKHNLQNAAGVVKLAKWVGIEETNAWQALSTFPGTAKRMEIIHQAKSLTVIRDFAHAPSKVAATVNAVREQFPDSKFVAVFEVHTFSSLNPEFMSRYNQTLQPANQAFILFDPHVFELKKMPIPSAEEIESRFGAGKAVSSPTELQDLIVNALKNQSDQHQVLLLMSSGNLGGIDVSLFFR